MRIAALGVLFGSLLALILYLALALTGPTQVTVRPVPACQEDEVIVGRGDFHASGYWDRYVCINVEEIK